MFRDKQMTPTCSALIASLLIGTSLSSQAQASDANDIFSVSGFGQVVAGKINTDEAEFLGYDNDVSFKPNTLLGIQVNAQATDYLGFTAQGVVRTSDSDDSDLDWLYATLKPDNNLAFKVGKLRTPFFMHSDVIDVGYAYHWISPPEQMYNAFLFPTFEGIDASWGYSTDAFDSTFEAYIGQHEGTIALNNRTTDYDVSVLGGVIASIKKDNFEFRASYHQGDVDIEVPELDLLAGVVGTIGNYNNTVDSLASEGLVKVTQLGLRYDNFDYFAALEWVNINPDLKTFMPEIDTYYVTGGYVFNPVTVHLTYAKSKLKYKDFPSEIAQDLALMSPSDPRYMGLLQSVYGINAIAASRSSDDLESWTIGARWDIRPRLALKTDITFLIGKDGDTAMFNSIDEGFDRKAQLYQVAVEWVF